MDNSGGKRHYELVLSIILISIVSLVFMVWVERLAIEVEKSKIQYTLANLRAAIKIYELTVVVGGNSADLLRQRHANPVKFLSRVPLEYAGEFEDANSVEKGSWFFDLKKREFVYLAKSVECNRNKAEQLRFRLEVSNTPSNGPGRLLLIERPYGVRHIEHE